MQTATAAAAATTTTKKKKRKEETRAEQQGWLSCGGRASGDAAAGRERHESGGKRPTSRPKRPHTQPAPMHFAVGEINALRDSSSFVPRHNHRKPPPRGLFTVPAVFGSNPAWLRSNSPARS